MDQIDLSKNGCDDPNCGACESCWRWNNSDQYKWRTTKLRLRYDFPGWPCDHYVWDESSGLPKAVIPEQSGFED